jgi:iron only hydrogenase large subunit-like protein
MDKPAEQQTIYTLTAKCRDCYRCLKVCPVKAIRMKDGQAYVEQSRCIACGTCIRECPQHAKTYISSLHEAKRILSESAGVAASIAPSFAAFFPGWQAKRVASALRQLGFERVAETAGAAYEVARGSSEAAVKNDKTMSICTACPAVVNYVEKYRPDFADGLLPVVSPMIAHARQLKSGPESSEKVVFIGPCVAKKYEASRPEYLGVVDCVLTFEELMSWFEEEKIDLKNCEESALDNGTPGFSRLFPLPGGMFRTAGIEAPAGDVKYLHVSGPVEVLQVFDAKGLGGLFLDPLFCEGGCINGPGAGSGGNIFEKRRNLVDYAGSLKQHGANVLEKEFAKDLIVRQAYDCSYVLKQPFFTEEEIKAVLEKTGKSTPEDLLNCGACGYKGCREKAIAVLDGMAELEMCLPYMRRLAEQRTDRIIETSPNGIVVLDQSLKIIKMNPAFKKFFSLTDTYLGSHISMIMDPAHFEKLASGTLDNIDISGGNAVNGYSFHELFYALRQYSQYVGIYVDVTSLKQDRAKLEVIRDKTAGQAKEMLDQQVKMSQQIAWQLGENMARTEELVRKLTELSGNGEKNEDKNKK